MNARERERFEHLDRLFSVVLHLDGELRVESASEVARERMPWLAERPCLTDAFEVVRPRGIESAEDVRDRIDQLFLLTARDGSFALRGQFLAAPLETGDALVFCGSPWLFWLNSNRPDLGLGIRDFSPQDSQLDQLFFMSTEKNMVSDLELLNAQLQEAKSELELAQRARDAFFAQMSHEMRTPLNGVVSALALLEQQAMTQSARELVSLIKSSSHNLMHVINYVLDVSKIEAEDGGVEQAPFKLDELVESVVEIVGARALEKDLGLHTRIKPGLPRTFVGDGPRLRQILLNLVTNAIKFTDSGEVTVRVADVEDRAGWIRIDVSDTGVGIPDELRERIYEPFFSLAQPTQNEAEKGTGLGLDIVRRNVKSMAGELELSSAPGRGSTFSLYLPLEPVEEAVPALDLQRGDSQPTGTLRGTILLVDDNQTNLMLGTMLLEGLGLTVRGVATGEDAVKAVRGQCYCAVLMDISMPGIDGIEATRQIRALPGRQDLPILALTAYASSREQARAREVGMNDYLTKPIGRTQLAEALSRWLPGAAECGAGGEAVTPDTPVNAAVLGDLVREIGAANLARVIETFGNEARKRWAALTDAPSAPDLAREAHALVSTCRSFGLDAIAETLAGIESRARDGVLTDSASLDELGDRLERSLDALSRWTQQEADTPA